MNTGLKRRRFPIRSGGALFATLALALVAAGPVSALPDGRGWELVSPVDKNGGQVDPPGAIAGGGVLQAAAVGGMVTYGSAASFAGGAGAPPASQYVSTRSSGGWTTQNITVPIFSGSYDIVDQGAPYRLFSPDLTRGLLLNGKRCRGEVTTGCPVANPTLSGTDAPAGFQNYYLRESGAFEALLGPTDVTGLDPTDFAVSFAGSSPDLRAVVLSSCARLTATATDGCLTDRENLYLHSGGTLRVLNGASPDAELAAPGGAVSTNGARIYWRDLGTGNLFLNQSGANSQVDTDAGGGGTFQVASADGSVAYFTKAGDLWRYTAGAATNIATGVVGVLSASASGDRVYFQDGAGLKQWFSGSTSTVAAGAAAVHPSTYPPATGASRVSADGTKLLFVSLARLTGYDNTDLYTSNPDSQVFLYDASAPRLTCVSCNPRGTRPIGPSTIPGAIANGTAPGSTQTYKPRVLSANGRRVFFDSADALVVGDSNAVPVSKAGINDVYQWEANGEGSCARASGCVEIISSGPSPDGASFVDASGDGSDLYFLTEASLVSSDPGSLDLYDARIGGGFPEPRSSIPCIGDACQELPPVPSNPTLTTTVPGVGNPPVTYKKYCRQGYVKRRGICVAKKKRARCRSGQVKRKGKCVAKRQSHRGSRR